MQVKENIPSKLNEESIAGKIKDKEILFIIPAFNEEQSIKATIQEIKSVGIPATILVVNDGSRDQTKEVAMRQGVLTITLPFNLGIGGAVQTGFKYARDFGFDIAVQVDGDGQHDAGYILPLIDPVLNDQADIAIGSRFIPPFVGYRSSFIRRIGINFFASMISFITQYRTTDPTSGFRAYNRKMIRVFSEYYPHDFPEPEAIVVAGRHHARIKEVPVRMRKRAHGYSSIRYVKTLYYMIKVTLAILLDKLKKESGNHNA